MRTMPVVRAVAVTFLGLGMLLAYAPMDAAAGSSRPVIAIHGLDAVGDPGVSCGGTWNDMERKFHDWGLSAAFIEISYYHGDTGCDHTINHHGRHWWPTRWVA